MWRRWVAAARQIKARDPTITVVVWFDTVHIYEQDTALDPDLKDREYKSPWETGCTSGNFRGGRYLDTHPSLLLMEENGEKKALDGMGCHIYNYGNPAARCASLALSPLPLILSYKSEKSLCGTGATFRRCACK